MRTTRSVAALLLLPTLTLTACSGDGTEDAQADPPAARASEPAGPAPTPSASTPSTPADEPAPAGSPSAAPDAPSTLRTPTGEPRAGDWTPPNTRLALGEKALVPLSLAEKAGAIGVTVTAVDMGKPADLEPFGLGDQVAGLTPYYVRVTVSNESGTDLSFSSLPLTTPLLGDGSPAQDLAVIGDFPQCPRGNAGGDFTTTGATYETCIVGLATDSSEVAGLAYRAGDYYQGVVDPPDYGLDPIIWLASGQAA